MNYGSPSEHHRIKMKTGTLLLPLALAVIAIVGCSTKAWYEGMKIRAQNDCRRLPPGEVESCLARVNTMTYDEYERKRLGQKQ
jgi:hypothetical protein